MRSRAWTREALKAVQMAMTVIDDTPDLLANRRAHLAAAKVHLLKALDGKVAPE